MPRWSPFRSDAARKAVLESYDHRLAQWPAPLRELDLASPYGRTHVVSSGPDRGPPLVLLAGGWANAALWQPFVSRLGPQHRILAVDAPWSPGKGEFSGNWPDPPSEWLASVLDVLELDTVSLVGFSEGAGMALRSLAGLGRRVRRLAAISASLDPVEAPWGVSAAGFWSRAAHGRLLQALAPSGRVDPDTRDYLAQIRFYCQPPPQSPRAEAFAPPAPLSTPALFVWGEKDSLGTLPEAVRRAREAFCEVSVEIVEGAGHLCLIEDPARVLGAVRAFLDG